LFTRVVIIRLVNTIWGVPTTLVIAIGGSKLLLKFLPIEIPFYPWPKFIANLVSTPLLTKIVLGATIISTPMVGMTTLSGWVTFISAGCFWIQQLPLPTFLVKLSWLEFDDAPSYDYPLVSSVVHNEDVNTPLVLCFRSKFLKLYQNHITMSPFSIFLT
jgi:hypothetical protein